MVRGRVQNVAKNGHEKNHEEGDHDGINGQRYAVVFEDEPDHGPRIGELSFHG